jgi:SPP1 family predicted phage head-tail adaptor
VSAPNLGELRHRLVLEELQREADGGGGFIETWGAVAELSAVLRPVSGSESVEADRIAGKVTHEIVLRYRDGVRPAMRFRKGARLFHIVSAIDVDERNAWLTCLCEEREL